MKFRQVHAAYNVLQKSGPGGDEPGHQVWGQAGAPSAAEHVPTAEGLNSLPTAAKMEELGHPEWLGELVNYATVPHSADDRIQSVAEFKVRLENQGEMP